MLCRPQPCVFLDRDGTLIVEKNYLADPDGVELLPRTADGLRLMRDLGFKLVVVTNQSGVGRGYYGLGEVEAVHDRLRELLAVHDIRLDGIFVCPHRPEDTCRCRKPRPGLVEQACHALALDLKASAMVGDKACDIELGRRCGLRTVLVETGYADADNTAPDIAVADLYEAAAWLAEQPFPIGRRTPR